MHEINISEYTPLDWALPLYGYVMPVLVALTTLINSFIIIVLSHRHLRTPTNTVLLTMAVTDLLTGCTSVPWFLYYYTFQGYQTDSDFGLDTFWCHAHAYLLEILPSIFHTAAIWLTVFLAIQRYVYVCVPNTVHLYCTPKMTKVIIMIIFLGSFLSVLPEILGKQRLSKQVGQRYFCYLTIVPWIVNNIGKDVFYSVFYWSRVILHAVPCGLLLVFTLKLGSTIKQAEIRKKSFAHPVDMERKTSYARGSDFSRISTGSGVGGGRSLYATNRMLALICTWFLLLEIPAAIIYVMHFLVANQFIKASPGYYVFFNRLLVIRNILIVLASPFQFAIYCSMSEQFRLTVRQLFTSRLLFVAQAQATFHGGKRYSLILVDVDTLETKKRTTSVRLSRFLENFTTSSTVEVQPRRKLNRQSSFPEELRASRDENGIGLCRGQRTLSTKEKNSRETSVSQYRKSGNTVSFSRLPSLSIDEDASNLNLPKNGTHLTVPQIQIDMYD
ncbi:unnamed protein product [Caenorhabditis auriculariae]|uniref:G-protein coupled receptors family 1 profile domain-containing protein n=1 Tax=Caenorhabditis auriculariae TaxID=2777116 RepID=A0A8S1HD06_9PELO|nr:unnamed protein product [Caenorhabditis auriculariae]